MSRQQGHRKSQSTSALNVLASPSPHHLNQSTATPRTSRRQGSSRLGAVVEDDSERSDRQYKPESSRDGMESMISGITTRTPRKDRTYHEKDKVASFGLEDLRAAIGDIRSLRSSDRRRLAAVRQIERSFVACCAGESGIPMSSLLALELHTALISLLTRHAQTLSHRASRSHTTLSAADEVAISLREELTAIFATIQGLCLVDKRAKNEMGQSWMLETIIDLMLVLRAQTAPEGEKPVVYLILDLLCCILVDSPVNSRTFESLNGLEGVVRVLKGTGVAKEVRMKCIEFLYFYLLPENSPTTQRNTSSSSTSTSSSGESQLFPPTPVSDDVNVLECPTTPSRRHRTPISDKKAYSDLDITFVPQTPQKPYQPNLGYLTPSTRRVSGSSNTSVSVPPSPRAPPQSPSHRRLMSVTDSHSDSDNSGLGLGLPRSDTAKRLSTDSSRADIPAINFPGGTDQSNLFNTTSSHTTSSGSSGSSTVMPSSRGISRSSTHAALITPDGMSRSSSMRRISDAPSFSQEFSAAEEAIPESRERAPKARHSISAQSVAASSSADPAARPPRARMSHSRTSIHLTDTRVDPLSSDTPRKSLHRVSRSGTSAQLSSLVDGPSAGDPRSMESRTSSSRSSTHAEADKSSTSHLPPSPRPMPRSSTSVQLTDSPSEMGRPPKPRASHTRTPSLKPPSPDTSMPPPPVPKPTPRKGFPAGITKGLPSAISSPNLNSPLTAAKRIPSGRLVEKRSGSKLKDVKSVEEKKELLGMWLGNVDALVQGVEKVSFWGSVPKH